MRVEEKHRVALKQAARGQENVVGLGLGFKYKRGEKTAEIAVVYNVREKIHSLALASKQLVPKSVLGVVTDVQEVGKVKILTKQGPVGPAEITQRFRPAPGGVSCGNEAITAGTLGVWVFKNGTLAILSNNHVLANTNEASIGSAVLQPGTYDGGTLVDRIATLSEFVTINFGDGPGGDLPPGCLDMISNLLGGLFGGKKKTYGIVQPNPNEVDCALALVVDAKDTDLTILRGVGRPLRVASAELGDAVEKCGRTTELKRGIVEQVDVEIQVDYGGPVASFAKQLIIRGDGGAEFSAGGDSGSAIVRSEDRALIGLLYAGGEGITVANRAELVQGYLGFSL